MFSLIYVSLYPMLTGSFIIYWYPHWPSDLALAYIAGGIVLQGLFCAWGGPLRGWSVAAQLLTGVAYLMFTLLISGSPAMISGRPAAFPLPSRALVAVSSKLAECPPGESPVPDGCPPRDRPSTSC